MKSRWSVSVAEEQRIFHYDDRPAARQRRVCIKKLMRKNERKTVHSSDSRNLWSSLPRVISRTELQNDAESLAGDYRVQGVLGMRGYSSL